MSDEQPHFRENFGPFLRKNFRRDEIFLWQRFRGGRRNVESSTKGSERPRFDLNRHAQWSTSVSASSIQCRISTGAKNCNCDAVETIISNVYHCLVLRLPKRRLRLILFACALLAVGCAHHRDSTSADPDHPRRHFGHRSGELETETETTTSFASPSPSPGRF